MNYFEKLFEKITNQSTLIVIVLFTFTFFALRGQDSFTSPLAIAGSGSAIIAIVLVIGNFFVNQINEGNKFVIEELKGIINTLKSTQKWYTKLHEGELSDQGGEKGKPLGDTGYTTEASAEQTKED